MSKHAYCILAHNEPEVFAKLITAIDYPENDIYVHVDRSANIKLFDSVRCNFSRLLFIKNRITCRWGTFSIVEAELTLLKEALNNGEYSYLHLLSGVDLPLKVQAYIHSFFDCENPGKNFIGFSPRESTLSSIRDKTSRYHLFIHRPDGSLIASLTNRLNVFSVKTQAFFHICRNSSSCIYKGPQWFSITKSFCAYLLTQEDEIRHRFRFTRCPDEMFVQTIFAASSYKDTLYSPDGGEFEQCMREIDWQRGNPYTWRTGDFSILRNSKKLFARKFSSKDIRIVDEIIDHYSNSIQFRKE